MIDNFIIVDIIDVLYMGETRGGVSCGFRKPIISTSQRGVKSLDFRGGALVADVRVDKILALRAVRLLKRFCERSVEFFADTLPK